MSATNPYKSVIESTFELMYNLSNSHSKYDTQIFFIHPFQHARSISFRLRLKYFTKLLMKP